MKKCTQCNQLLSDEVSVCFKCGGSSFEPAADQPGWQQAPNQQPPNEQFYQPSYQTAYEQPPYRPNADNSDEPATIGDYLLFTLFMIIPIFNLVYLIMVAVGGPKYKKSMTNYARAMLILWAICLVLVFLLSALGAFSAMSYFRYGI